MFPWKGILELHITFFHSLNNSSNYITRLSQWGFDGSHNFSFEPCCSCYDSEYHGVVNLKKHACYGDGKSLEILEPHSVYLFWHVADDCYMTLYSCFLNCKFVHMSCVMILRKTSFIFPTVLTAVLNWVRWAAMFSKCYKTNRSKKGIL